MTRLSPTSCAETASPEATSQGCSRLANEDVFVAPTGELIKDGPENTGTDDHDGQPNFATRSLSND
jgi:hypothetical protein